MTRRIYWFIIVLTCCAGLRAEEARAPFTKLGPANGDTIVFLGDSITQQCLYTQYLENYFYTRYPHVRLNFHNAGVSGDTTADALTRFDRDVAAYRPRYVTILLGMNDGAAKQFETQLFDTYRADMQQLVERIRGIGAVPIVMAPTMYDARLAQANPKPDRRGRGGYYNGVLALYGTWLRDQAGEHGWGFVDLHGPLNHFTFQSRKVEPAFTLVPDGIHPDASGQIVMTFAIVSDLGLSRRSSTIEIARSATGEASAKVSGGQVTDARFNDDGLAFRFQPTSLPMAVPPGAEKGAALIPLGHRLSYEALYVHGLKPGRYTLSINDQTVGEYSADVLASKLELQSNPKTPQYQQSLRVAELNAGRNAQVVSPLRDLWRAKKTLERTRQELAAAPGDEALQKRLVSYERKLADFDSQIRALDAQSQTVVDQIYQANQPQALHFRVSEVK